MRAPDIVEVEDEAKLAAAMRALSFPTTRVEAARRVGSWPLLEDADGRLTMDGLLAGMRDASFRDRALAAKEEDRRFAAIQRMLAAVGDARPLR
jgi:hypothetical protein